MFDNDINKKNRKEILKKIDSNSEEEYSISTLGYYDMSPYFPTLDEKDITSMKLIDLKFVLSQYARKINHIKDKEVYFFNEQLSKLNELKKHDKILFSAPTSFGKTLIIKELIYVEKINRIVIIVPTNALGNELENSFKENEYFSKEYIIFNKALISIDEHTKKFIFIGTQEKFLENKERISSKKIDLFVIDEAYKLQKEPNSPKNNQRLFKINLALEWATKRENVSKMILLMPEAKFKNAKEKYGLETVESTFNIVEKEFYGIKKENWIKEINKKIRDKEKTIYFCKTPQQIFRILDDITNEKNELSKETENLLKNINKYFHKDWHVAKALSKNILVHHGQMPKYLQTKMLNIFNKRDNGISLMVGTNSISEGINTFTKNIFIDKSNLSNESLLIKNTIGRAGRLGIYPIGNIYILDKKEATKLERKNSEIIEIEFATENEEFKNEIEATQELSKLSWYENKGIDKTKARIIIEKNQISSYKFQEIWNLLLSADNEVRLDIIGFAYEIFDSKINEKMLIKKNIYFDNYLKKESLSILINSIINSQEESVKKQIINIVDKIEKSGFFFKEKEIDTRIKKCEKINSLKFLLDFLKELKKSSKNKTTFAIGDSNWSKLNEKLNHFSYKNKNKEINDLMKFIYSELNNIIALFINISSEILSEFKDHFNNHENLKKEIQNFKFKINEKFGLNNLGDDEKIIKNALLELGMQDDVKRFTSEIISEIIANLKIKYFINKDLIIIIKKLSETSKKNNSFYLEIVNKYF